jgi:hypothetical protein
MQSTTIAVDLAKSVFEVAVSRRPGKVDRRRRLSRGQFSRFLAEQAPATVVMEACGTAHFWGREARARGHRVVLIPPHAVRPYVLRNKTDGADAKGLLEALRNDDLRPVPVKSVDPHVLASLHRLRSAWMATRTARLNTLRGLLRELGFAIPVGARQVVPFVAALVSDGGSALPDALRPVLAEARDPGARGALGRPPAGPRESLRAQRAPDAPAHGPRHRSAHRDSSDGLRRGRPALPLGTPLRKLPGPHSARDLQRPALAPGRDHQARRPLPADAAHPRGPGRAPARQEAHRPPRCAPGRLLASRRAATTRPPSRSPTSSPASSGPSGAASTPTAARPQPPRSDPPTPDRFEHTRVTTHRS